MPLPVNNPPQGQQRKGNEIIYGNVPAQADNNVLSGGFRVRSIR